MPPFDDSRNRAASAAGPHLLRSEVYEYLRTELKKESLSPGMFVSMAQLMKSLGISRTPLRDALLQLQLEGFVTFLPQRGIRINELSRQDIEDIYEMLGALDSRALLAVFDRLGPEHIQRMQQINEQMAARSAAEHFDAYWELNSAFHGVYLAFSTNRPLLNQLSILRQRLLEFGKRDWSPLMRANNYTEHITLIDLIQAGDAVAAADYLRDVHCLINFDL